jgi:hypothetical protein
MSTYLNVSVVYPTNNQESLAFSRIHMYRHRRPVSEGILLQKVPQGHVTFRQPRAPDRCFGFENHNSVTFLNHKNDLRERILNISVLGASALAGRLQLTTYVEYLRRAGLETTVNGRERRTLFIPSETAWSGTVFMTHDVVNRGRNNVEKPF